MLNAAAHAAAFCITMLSPLDSISFTSFGVAASA
jgi:hypothetical protein